MAKEFKWFGRNTFLHLTDATYEETGSYTSTHPGAPRVSKPGFGTVRGTVVEGYTISRLFQFTRRDEEEPGTRRELHYIKRSDFDAGEARDNTCG